MHSSRRSTLRALAGITAGALAPRAAPVLAQDAGAPTLAQFGALSASLTGFPQADPDTLARMLKAFATPARRTQVATLARLVAATPPAGLDVALRANRLDTLAGELVAAWYSGVVTVAQGPKVVLYTEALVWSAMTYSKPMGVCGGVTGYWANPPA